MKYQKINKMKKIMFNDKFLLTQAVLRGEKTQTRRIIKDGTPLGNFEETLKHSPYKVGEVVAVAQSYKAIYDELEEKVGNYEANEWWCDAWDIAGGDIDISAGYTNKMYVKAELMPHKIKITSVRIERLQDISNDDCLCEGIFYCTPAYAKNTKSSFGFQFHKGVLYMFDTAREAFAALIDKASGKGTWESNPYVWVYDFELVK